MHGIECVGKTDISELGFLLKCQVKALLHDLWTNIVPKYTFVNSILQSEEQRTMAQKLPYTVDAPVQTSHLATFIFLHGFGDDADGWISEPSPSFK